MYAVVGCTDCSALWIVEGTPETTECRRCGSRHTFEKLRKFIETADRAEARDHRATILAQRQGVDPDELDGVEAAASQLDDVGVDDTTYLESAGIDTDAVEAAADRAMGGRERMNNQETVIAAIETLESPTTDAITDWAVERGVDRQTVQRILDKLVRAGEVTDTDSGYRML